MKFRLPYREGMTAMLKSGNSHLLKIQQLIKVHLQLRVFYLIDKHFLSD